jgi:hypothetical protein
MSRRLARGGRPGEVVRDHIVRPGAVDHVRGKLCYKSKLPLLPRAPRCRNAVEGGHQRLVVSPQLEMPALEQEPKMPNGEEAAQQFPVKSGVLLLACEFVGEKS